MRTILKHGNTLYHLICPNCNCEFLYDWKAISLMENKNKTYSDKVQCPECDIFILATKEKYNDINSECKV